MDTIHQPKEDLYSLYSTIFDVSALSIIANDTTGIIIAFNPAAERMLGYTAEEMVGKQSPVIIHDAEEIRQHAARLSAELGRPIEPGYEVFSTKPLQGIPDENEWTYIRKDGSRFPVMLSVMARYNDKNEHIGFVGIAKDISERKEAEQALAASEARIRDIAATTTGIIYQFTVSGNMWKMNYISPSVLDLFGISAEAVMEDADILGETIHPDDYPNFLSTIMAAAETVTAWNYEGRLIKKPSEELHWWEARSIPRRLPNGDVVFNGTIYDVTRHKNLLEELNQSAEKYREIVEGTRDGIMRIDPRGDIIFVNPRVEEMFGYTSAEMAGRNIYELIKPSLRESTKNRVRTRAEGVHEEYELCWIRKDGSELWVINAAHPVVGRDGKHLGSVGIMTDITERKQHEHERERLIKDLNDALLFKDQFLATMSHELRTPLNAIIGYAGIALMQEELSTDGSHMLERISVNSQRLLNLINDILDISRINANRIEILQRPVNLSKLAQGWHDDFRQQVENKGLSFAFGLDAVLPEMIVGDEERLSQIVANLLHNAIKFTDKGEIKLKLEKQDETWTIQVIDSGIGIPETWQHLIFEEFRQVDSSSRRKHGGAGLGLSIVQKLALLMNGSINVQSKPGEGSTFTVTLPLTVPLSVPQSN
jgi:PAS domain S-box-containing protein